MAKKKKKEEKEELKKKLYKLIDSIDDEHVLNVLTEDVVPYVIQSKAKEGDDLTEEEIKEIKAGLEEIERGETMPWEELKKEMAKKEKRCLSLP